MSLSDVIEISGAGPAGLAAAIAIGRSGRRACIHERRADVGLRFHGDFQGLENWTTEADVLAEIAAFGVEPEFDHKAFREVVVFDPVGIGHTYRSEHPLFYLVTRGNGDGTLDTVLKRQALAAGDVTQTFGKRIIIAAGDGARAALAAGEYIRARQTQTIGTTAAP